MRANPYQISAFTQSAREGSFTRAAEKLGVTQSSVTQHVANLERTMGTKLFVRRRDGLELTRAGRELFAVSDRLRNLEQLIEEKVANYSEIAAGHLSVVANAPRPAMPVIARYATLFPRVQIEFTLVSWTLAMQRLRERAVDVAIVTEPVIDEQLYSLPLARTRYHAYVRRDHRFARRKKLSLRDLAEEAVIVPEDGSLTQRLLHQKCGELGITLTRLVKTTTFPVVKEAVLHGIGVGLLLDDSMSASSELIGIEITDMNETYANYLLAPVDKRELRFVRSFIDVAREVLDIGNEVEGRDQVPLSRNRKTAK
ncbi:LysR family transcriptional regulator [Bradyrhizobium sp. Leo170]|uniref:LysR family transcriptional regulator n=1 Tax=Bradyrhizobium sp. Leo170 TaxID=1571199 RepID=UPI00102EC2AE|nr:LysR family transcriptional regulator [Bradyrhizobium sp. Leo170]TAI67444.1 LysR family transcriptional regulator [Bradyrhizobium sp. Leo170]